jgi:hypothetical protein
MKTSPKFPRSPFADRPNARLPHQWAYKAHLERILAEKEAERAVALSNLAIALGLALVGLWLLAAVL